MADPTIFKRIIDGEIPADVVYEDDRCLAFRDVSPQAPVHILIIPKEEIVSLAHTSDSHESLLGHLLLVTRQLAAEQGLDDGFRTIINTGAGGGQTVFHLHIHLMGGRSLTWPPG